MRITDTDAASFQNTAPAKVLAKQEKDKKAKYGQARRQAHKTFTPLVYSVDGLEGTEASAARKRLAARLAAKWGRQYSQICGFIRSRVSLALVRSTSRCLRGTRNSGLHHRRSLNLDWVAGAGLGLYQT